MVPFTKASLTLMLLLLSHVIAPVALAQETNGSLPKRPRVSANELLGGQPVADSFDSLQAILTPGDEVVVWDQAGRKIRGRLRSLSGDEVTIIHQIDAAFRTSSQEYTSRAEGVTRIDIVDSTVNGVLLGAAVGVGIVAGIDRLQARQARRQHWDSQEGLGYVFVGLLAFPAAIWLGHHIDLIPSGT